MLDWGFEPEDNQPRLAMRAFRLLCLFASLASVFALAQTNPVPFVNQPLLPMTAAPGGSGFTLTINGTQFVTGSVVQWNGKPLATTFVSATQLTAEVPASNIATAGTAAVVVSNPTPGGGTSNVEYLSVSMSVTSPTFAAFVLDAGAQAASLITADLNGDGKLDLIEGAPNDTIYVQLGNGDGTFQAALSYSVAGPGPTNPIIVADFNDDGKPDILVASSSGTSSVLLGNGDGTFQAAKTVPVFPSAVGDFNRDGKLDLVVVAAAGVSLLAGNGDGTFQAPISVSAPVPSPGLILVGDFNGDGVLDLASVSSVNPAAGPASVSLLAGNGDGTFQSPITTVYWVGIPTLASTGDFNGDGKLDLALLSISGLYGRPQDGAFVNVLLGNGDGTFSASGAGAMGAEPVSLAIGDFNADGKLDLAVSSAGNSMYGIQPQVFVALGNGDGTLQSPIGYQPLTTSLVVGDFNGDGKMDLLGIDGSPASLQVFLQGPARDFLMSTSSPNQTVSSGQTAMYL